MKKIYLFVLMVSVAIFSSCDTEEGVEKDKDNSENLEEQENPSSEILWSTSISHSILTTTNHYPAVDDSGNVYLITKAYGEGSIIQAFDKDGNELWKKQKDEYPRNYTVSYRNGNIYFLTNKELVCLNAQDGSDNWMVSESIVDDLEIGNQDNFTFVGNDLVIPLINLKGTFLVKLDAVSGNSNGATKVCEQNRVVPRIAAKGNTIYLAEDSLYAISGSAIVWKANIEDTERTTKDVYDLIVTQNDDVVVSLRNEINNGRGLMLYKSQELLWSKNYGSDVLIPKISELSNGNLVLAMGDLMTVDATSGNQLWKLDSEILKSFETANVAGDGNIYGGNDYGIWGIDKEGNTIFEYKTDGDPISNSCLQNDENIIVLSMGTDNSLIHCISRENTGGCAQDLWSGYGADAANTFNVN